MTKRVVFLHTVTSLAGLFSDLSKELLPAGTEVFHIADEMLLKLAMAQGGLSPFIYRRVSEHAVAAEAAGAAVLQLTCSSISPCASPVRNLVSIPVLKIDEPMVDQALAAGSRVGVAATVATTLNPTTELVYQRANALGKQVEVDSVLCQGAFQALMAGDTANHDRIVYDNLKQLMDRNQVVILAQASMARVAKTIPPEEQTVPILSSPRLAVERLRQELLTPS